MDAGWTHGADDSLSEVEDYQAPVLNKPPQRSDLKNERALAVVAIIRTPDRPTSDTQNRHRFP